MSARLSSISLFNFLLKNLVDQTPPIVPRRDGSDLFEVINKQAWTAETRVKRNIRDGEVGGFQLLPGIVDTYFVYQLAGRFLIIAIRGSGQVRLRFP